MADDAPMRKQRPVRAGTEDCLDKWFREDPTDYPPTEWNQRGKEQPQSPPAPSNEERARGYVKGKY